MSNKSPQIRLSGQDKIYLRTAAQWSQILSYLIALFAILVMIDMCSPTSLINRGHPADDNAFFSSVFMICFILALFFAWFMYALGKKVENALLFHDSELLATGFNYLKGFIKLAAIGVILASFIVIPVELLMIAFSDWGKEQY